MITEYISQIRSKSKGKVKSAIIERWNTRVIPRNLHTMGKAGAQSYLDSYGKGISAAKVSELALCAEHHVCYEVAAGFWEAAYFLETGEKATFSPDGQDSSVAVSAPQPSVKPDVVKDFPSDLQPGFVATMQPTDAEENVCFFASSPYWIGQPKRDGMRNLVFVTKDAVFHQSRSTKLMSPLHADFDNVCKDVAAEIGAFILDGERYYLSFTGSEHRTAAQCATANIESGHADVQPRPAFAVFDALFFKRDLRNDAKIERLNIADDIVGRILCKLSGKSVYLEMLLPYQSKDEKLALDLRQKDESREGHVWTRRDATYTSGKSHQDSYRIKFLQEAFFTVAGFKESKSDGRTVASFELVDDNGKNVGSVGTGFDEATALEIVSSFKQNSGKVQIEVRSQGTTENGILWHPRMIGWRVIS